MGKRVKKNKPVSNRIGIRWKMFALLMLFTGLAILITWVCGVRLLSRFYQQTKFNDINLVNTSIVAALENPKRLDGVVEYYADEYYSDIWIYTVKGDSAYMLAEATGTGNNRSKYINQHTVAMYEKALLNGGSYIVVVPTDEFENALEVHIISDNMGGDKGLSSYRPHTEALSALSLNVLEMHGERYIIMQVSNLTPDAAMVKTLQNQFLAVGILLILLSLVFAEVMSRLITKPFIKMSRAAKQLAKGNYDVEFSGEGYREVSDLADTLNYAAGELSQIDALQQELIANLSHDLRTPLTMIKGYSEVMRDIPNENTPENVQVIIDEAERLTELVNDVLDLSKIQSGAQKLTLEVFSLTETVRSTMHRYEKLTSQDGYTIEFFSEENADICADRGMILQVVYNLINNAIHYTGDDLCVIVKQSRHGDNVRISVSDTGDGISPEQIPQIWDRYYKVDKVHKRARVGTGIGLSIVKKILELHNADYGVESSKDIGSTFWFELPIAMPEQADEKIQEGLYENII